MSASPTPRARIHDIRYRRAEAPPGGRGRAVWSFTRWSIRRALGAGMGWRGKVGPIVLVLLAFGPALVLIGLRALLPTQINFTLLTDRISFGAYAQIVGVDVLLFAALIGPRLVSTDRRDRVLPLYFATAVSRREYLAAKLAAAWIPMATITIAPVLTLFGGNVVFADHPIGYLQAHGADIARILAGGALMACYWAPFALAMSSLTRRAAFAVAGFVALAVGSGAVSGALSDVASVGDDAHALNLVQVPIALYDRQFPDGPLRHRLTTPLGLWTLTFLVVIAASLAVLWLRYRRAEP